MSMTQVQEELSWAARMQRHADLAAPGSVRQVSAARFAREARERAAELERAAAGREADA